MKSPKVKGIGEVVTEYGAKVMKVIKKGLLGRSLFDFYGDVKTNALRVKESPSVPQTPIDQDGGVVYVKTADGKLYYKSNEVAEVELSAHTGLSTEEVQDIAGALVATGGTKTGIAVTYQDATGDVDFVVDHDAATNYVAAEHYRWDNDIQSTATINHLNLSSDTGTETEVLVMNGGDAVWGHGEKIHVQVRNDEGSTITAGAPLYSKGEIGGSNRIKVGVCDANDAAKMPCIGIAHAEMNTSSTKDNFAVVSGIYNTNISGFTSLAVGDNLYIQDDGSLSQTKPTGESSLVQNVGIVLKTNGSSCQGLLVSAIGRTNDVPNLDNGDIFIGNASNQPETTSLSSLLPPDLTVSGAGTVHTDNYIENVSTNLSYTTGSDRITIVSSDGTNVVIAEASSSIAGVMSAVDHDKLEGIEDSATADQTKSDIDGLGITTVGALSSGTIASGFGNIDNGTSTLDTGLATVSDLHVSIAGQATLDLIDTGGQTYKIFVRNSDDVFGLYDGTNTQTFFRYTGHATPASTKLALLEAGGKVGIGTTSPSQALDVSGNVNISGTIELGNATDTTLDRVSAGVVSIEGAHVKTQSLTIKVFPNQFINNDDTGRPVFLEDDTSNTLAARGHSTGDDFYAFVEIPPLHKVTHVQVHASANTSSAVSVRSFNYQTGADNAIAATTANFNENKAVTNIPATATQDLVIKCTPGANTVLVYGATVTLALI